ncbi:hypothetical protein RV02_GL002827 [Enterococcus gilvus]|nr:hypothetical protein RV02_GL002827 [Enterococcus gilvus]
MKLIDAFATQLFQKLNKLLKEFRPQLAAGRHYINEKNIF